MASISHASDLEGLLPESIDEHDTHYDKAQHLMFILYDKDNDNKNLKSVNEIKEQLLSVNGEKKDTIAKFIWKLSKKARDYSDDTIKISPSISFKSGDKCQIRIKPSCKLNMDFFLLEDRTFDIYLFNTLTKKVLSYITF